MLNFDDYAIKDRHSYSRSERCERQLSMNLKFREDLFRDFGISDHPKANLLFEKAWEFGHADGYREVYGYASELVELIR